MLFRSCIYTDGVNPFYLLLISRPDPLYFNPIAVTNVSIVNGNNGALHSSVFGGTPPLHYLWSNGETTPDISNLTAGTYSLTVTDANQCTASGTAIVNSPLCTLVASVQTTPNLCYGGSAGTATAGSFGAIGNVKFLWSNGNTNSSITGLSTGNYTVYVTDQAGCTAMASGVVDQPIIPFTVSVTQQPVL